MRNGMVGQWTKGFKESHVDKTGWKQALKKTFSLQGANKSGRDKNNQALLHTIQPSTGYVNKEHIVLK